MAQPHAQRDHATWSASASDRRWGCPGSLAMEADAPADKESHAAAWGTAAHEVAEDTLRNGGACIDRLGRVVKTKSHEIEVDDEVAETAQEFVDYVLRRLKEYKDATGRDDAVLLIEQKFSLDKINPPFQAGGTGDAVLLFSAWGLIEIVDLKGGRGFVVEALGNKQLRTYALGAMLANPGPWKAVRATIVQPRAPHHDGRIRSEEISTIDLLDWTHDLLEAMDNAKGAMDWRNDHTFGSLPMDEWVEDFLNPGDHCTFCRAKATCPALQGKALEIAQTHFAPTGEATTPPAPDTLEVNQLVRILDHADMIQNWLNAVRAHAQDLAESGVEVTNGVSTYVLTQKQARRKWKDEADTKTLAERTKRLFSDFLAEPKMLSPAQAEKLLGKKGYAEIADLVDKSSSGFNLTRSDKTTRPAAVPPPQQHFQVEKGD